MKKYYCNPVNMEYRYQFIDRSTHISVSREAADPSVIAWKGSYYMFPSMSRGCYKSDDLCQWTFMPLNGLPFYDYAPDVCVCGDAVLFCASKKGAPCDYYVCADFPDGVFQKVEGEFDFWDPKIFCDDDGRLYLYWGCSNLEPIYGVELDAKTLKRIGEPKVMFGENRAVVGYERFGMDHVLNEKENSIYIRLQERVSVATGKPMEEVTRADIDAILPPDQREYLKLLLSDRPYMEGAWLNKYKGRYYLQYACPGTELNVYGDGVYCAEHPLGPYTLAKNNPYSYHPGGFITGAGHGSTFEDTEGRFWHCSTARISRIHPYERRVGLWRAGFDKEGELYCDQRFGDWVHSVDDAPFEPPRWMLLSYAKPATASSGVNAGAVTDENIYTFWRSDRERGSVTVDLCRSERVHAIQVNFADEGISASVTDEQMRDVKAYGRYIDKEHRKTRWLLEGSTDGENFFIIEDKRHADTDLAHDLVVREEGMLIRFVRLTVMEMPFGQNACVSGLRIFGVSNISVPHIVRLVRIERSSDGRDVYVEWTGDAMGYNVLWGHAPDKLYHCKQVLSKKQTSIGALVAGQKYWLRIDSFNEGGMTEGVPMPMGG